MAVRAEKAVINGVDQREDTRGAVNSGPMILSFRTECMRVLQYPERLSLSSTGITQDGVVLTVAFHR